MGRTHDCLLHGKGPEIFWETREGDSCSLGNLTPSMADKLGSITGLAGATDMYVPVL
jgi:hypothetical protein